MRPRFQADNDLRNAIRTGVLRREPAIDFRSAKQAGLDGIPDFDVLRRAAEEGRILVSHDENTMPAHFQSFLAAGNRCGGVILVPQRIPTAIVIESLLLIWIATDTSEWRGKLDRKSTRLNSSHSS